MSEPRFDRRVSRTRRQLREALMALILEKGYDSITIEEITDRADLGRTTFYLHYRDKEALLLESLEAIADDLRSQIRLDRIQVGSPEPVTKTAGPIHEVFRHAAQHSDLYKIILSGGAAARVLNHVREMLQESAEEFFGPLLAASHREESPPSDSFAGYFASALLGFLTWWLDKGMPYSPDQTADLFLQLFLGGARQYMQDIPLGSEA